MKMEEAEYDGAKTLLTRTRVNFVSNSVRTAHQHREGYIWNGRA